jgi:ABC-type dipeptide/oligopeptide/nickel transport system permease component
MCLRVRGWPDGSIRLTRTVDARDPALIAGGVPFATPMSVSANLHVYLSRAWVDPRVRLGH